MQKDFWLTALEPPRYGYVKEGQLYKPTYTEMISEFFYRINIFRDRRNWLFFLYSLGNIGLLSVFIYGMFHTPNLSSLEFFALSCVSLLQVAIWEIYIHRYKSHGSFQFKYSWFKFLVKFVAFRDYADETHVIPHIVHHKYSDQPGDPYNAKAGWFYCYIADFLHQRINQNLSKANYQRLAHLFKGEFFKINSYEQYKKWGTIVHPASFLIEVYVSHILLSAIYYAIGGFDYVIYLHYFRFYQLMVFQRNANYVLHRCGRTNNKSEDPHINNNLFFGLLSNYHSNHHKFPKSAKTGFKFYQLDPIHWFIFISEQLGLVGQRVDHSPKPLQKVTNEA